MIIRTSTDKHVHFNLLLVPTSDDNPQRKTLFTQTLHKIPLIINSNVLKMS